MLAVLLAIVAATKCASAIEPQLQAIGVYPLSGPVVYTVYYDFMPVSYWHWTPELGWHVHTYYQYVPHWVPSRPQR